MSKDKLVKSISPDAFYDDSYPDYFDVNDVTIVVPTLNERSAIGLVLEDIRQQGYENILVVDGNSTDGTIDVINGIGVKHVTQEGNGKTGAIKTAIKSMNTPYMALIDGDCTYSARDIERLVPHISEHQQVIGARSSGRENIKALNRFGNWAINTLFNLLFGTRLTDVCSGMYLLQTKFAKSIPLTTEGFDVEVEIAAHAARNGSVAEVPISYHPRVGTQKLHPFRDGAKIIYRILVQGWKMHPLRLISLAEACLLLPAILLINSHFDIHLLSFQQSSLTLGFISLVLAVQGITLYLVDTRFIRRNGTK